MMRYVFALLALLGSVAAASAQGLTTMTVLDSTGATKTYRMVQDASSRLSYTHTICDPTTGANAIANCATVSNGSLSVNVTNANSNGRAAPGASSPVVLPANKYIAVAASQTATALVGAGSGATGDYLSHCVIYPTATTTGVVTVFDNTNTAPNSAILFAGGSSSTSNLTPISVPVGAVSVNGAWKVTTGTAVSVVCYGNFT